MKLKQTKMDEKGLLFPERSFDLIDDEGLVVGKLMILEIRDEKTINMSVEIEPDFRQKGYAKEGVKMLMEWGSKNGFEVASITSIFPKTFPYIKKIADGLGFARVGKGSWKRKISVPAVW